MKTLLATKQYMTQVFDESGKVWPVTVVLAAAEGTFDQGAIVAVSGVSKGKGFQGVVKRHGFSGGPRSHGQKHSEREPGSIGATGPQRVFKGVRMGGRMGGTRVTVKKLKIVKVDKDNNLLYISGAIPGRKGTKLEIKGV